MTEFTKDTNYYDKLEERVDYLEHIDRSMMDSLELIVTLGGHLSSSYLDQNISDIFNETKQQLKRLMKFRTLSFSIINNVDFDFKLTHCEPKSDKKLILKEIDEHITIGNFAWALRQNHPVIIAAEHFPEAKVIFHSLSTKSKALGMFIGIIPNQYYRKDDLFLDLLSIVLFHCAQSIENSDLYRKIKAQTNKLKKINIQLKQEIKERRRIEEALREREEMARALLNAPTDAAYLINLDGTIIDANEAAVKALGKQLNEIRDKNIYNFFPQEVAKSRKITIKKVTKTGKPIRFEDEVEGRSFDHVIYPVQDAKKKVSRLAVFTRDITQQKRSEEHRRKLEHELMQHSRFSSIGFLAEGIAHNLKSPLAAIMGYVDIYQMKYPELKELKVLIDLGETMNQIINTMMIKSHREQQTKRNPINLNELLKIELSFLEGNFNFKHDIKKEYNFQEEIPLIEGVYSDFSQSLMNIINNAIDAMYNSREKKLRVSTRSDNSFIYIEITDTGCGIDKNHIPQLFSPFFTTKPIHASPESKEPSGTGLGLYSTYQILEPYGATFDIKSDKGKGTTFTVQFPVDNNK